MPRKSKGRIAQPIPGAIPDSGEVARAFDQDDDREESEGEQQRPPVSDEDAKLLKKIRDDYTYCLDYWRENREQMATDMDFVAGKFLENKHRDERKANGRPIVEPDEISQFIKQANNNRRQSKRGIQVIPRGSGATDKDAERRGAIIRGVEYKSNAQAAYTTAFEQCTECGFGAFRLTLDYITQDGFDVEPRIKRIANQFTVLFDPDAKEADFSDAELCFVTDVLRRSEFARRYPNAQKKSFDAGDAKLAPQWIQGENIVIAEYWRVEKTQRTKQRGDNPDEAKDRTFYDKQVVQYITNGVEILEKNVWPGSWIPIIGIFGEEIYTNDNGQSKRVFLSLVRRMRVPQTMLAYITSQEAEEFGQAPRAPIQGYVGQFETDKKAWTNSHREPRAYLQVDRPSWWNDSWGPPPMPTKPQFAPNIEPYQVAKEAWKRGIQSAAGISPLPTAAQRQNEKSGIALEKIQNEQATGSYHISDNADRALENCGRQINELITKVMDTPRHVGIRQPDEKHALMYVTTEAHLDKLPPEVAQQNDYLVTDRGEFDVTISAGPSQQSQREQASDFVDLLLQNINQLPPPGSPQALILAKAIRLKNLGPIGEELADILDPPSDEDIPPQVKAKLAQAQGQMQQMQQLIVELQKEKEGKIVEMQGKKELEQIKANTEIAMQKMKFEHDLAMAEVTTKAQDLGERKQFVEDLWKQFHGQAHEAGMQAEEHSHAHEIADKSAAVAGAQQATQIAADQQAAEAQPQAQ